MPASETGGELVGWGSCVPVSVGAFFLRAWQKCQRWGSHTLLFLCVYGPSSLSQCSKCFWSPSTKGFIFQELWEGFQFPHACNIFCDFLLLNVGKGCIFSWPHTVVAMCSCSSVFTVFAVGKNQSLQYSFSDIKTWIFNLRINYFYITGLQFADLILFCIISPLSSADLRGFW